MYLEKCILKDAAENSCSVSVGVHYETYLVSSLCLNLMFKVK